MRNCVTPPSRRRSDARSSACTATSRASRSDSGPIGKFRVKSDERVLQELDVLRGLGVRQLYVEDDSLFGQKPRALRLLRAMQDSGFHILGVNGINIVHMLKRHEPDDEVIDALVGAGFRDINLPFESANPRIVRTYASNKWDVQRSNVAGLIRRLKDRGFWLSANYMIGYPDESREEIEATINLAREHHSLGVDAANIFLVIPLPGTPIFDLAVERGHLPGGFDPDRLTWNKANMVDTLVPAEELEEIRASAWEDLNDPRFVAYKKSMLVSSAAGIG